MRRTYIIAAIAGLSASLLLLATHSANVVLNGLPVNPHWPGCWQAATANECRQLFHQAVGVVACRTLLDSGLWYCLLAVAAGGGTYAWQTKLPPTQMMRKCLRIALIAVSLVAVVYFVDGVRFEYYYTVPPIPNPDWERLLVSGWCRGVQRAFEFGLPLAGVVFAVIALGEFLVATKLQCGKKNALQKCADKI